MTDKAHLAAPSGEAPVAGSKAGAAPKFTRGPWEASRRDLYRFQVATIELYGIYSPHPEYGGDSGTPEADAALIAAAPDLYEALEQVENWMPRGAPKNLIERIRAALAKARGE